MVRKHIDSSVAPLHPNSCPLWEAAEALQQSPAGGQRWVLEQSESRGCSGSAPYSVVRALNGAHKTLPSGSPSDIITWWHCLYRPAVATRNTVSQLVCNWLSTKQDMELSSLFFKVYTCLTKQCISPTDDASCDHDGTPGGHFWRNWHVNSVFLSCGPSEFTASHNGRLQNNKEGAAMCDRTNKFVLNNPVWEPSLEEYILHNEIYMELKKNTPNNLQ